MTESKPAGEKRPAPREGRTQALDKTRIARAAVAVMDRLGGERLTARAVAAELGVTPMALYRHYPSMEALGVAVFERVIGEARLDEAERDELAPFLVEIFARIYDAFVAHPGALRLLGTPASLSDAALEVMAACMAELRAARVDEARAVGIFHSLLAHTLGSALLTATMRERDRGRPTRPAPGGLDDFASRGRFMAGLEERVSALVPGEPELADGLRAICRGVGFDLDRVDQTVRERLRLLGELSETVEDVKRAATHAESIFAHVARTRPDEAFDEAERRVVVLGSLFSDLGKTGPRRAGPEARRLVVEMFSVEGVRDDAQPVTEFLQRHFPADAERRVALFRSLGLDPAMPIRSFWNLHSGWTLELLEGSGVPAEAIAAAAAHHLLDDVNPQEIVGEDGRFTRQFGDNVAFDRAEKLVILLDKYDALRRRGGRSHRDAMAWLRRRLGESPEFRGDPEFRVLLDDLDAAPLS